MIFLYNIVRNTEIKFNDYYSSWNITLRLTKKIIYIMRSKY